MPTRKPARRARRSAPRLRLPALEQRQLDLIGLGLVALGLFFAFLVYFGWDGGRAGSRGVEGLRWLLGAGHYLVPVALMGAAVPLGRDLPVPGRDARPLGRNGRPRRRAARVVRRRLGQDARRDGGGDA